MKHPKSDAVHLTESAGNAATSGEVCPTCDGGRTVLDLHHTPPRRLPCKTCAATGVIDAGVWPYEPWPQDVPEASGEPIGDMPDPPACGAAS